MPGFEGRVVIITGGCGGLGRASARLFLDAGASVGLLDIKSDGQMGDDSRCVFIRTDVSDEESFSQSLDSIVQRFGRLDILVNCAGVIGPNTLIQDTKAEDFDRVLAVNARGVFLGIKLGSKRMSRGGVIINVASDAGLVAWPRYSAYGASKAAVISLTKYAAIELAPLGIRVNGIAPSTIETTKEMSSDEEKAITLAIQALPKIMSPEEIGRVLLFLASDEASMITGQTLVVDGGWTAGLSMGLYDLILHAQGR